MTPAISAATMARRKRHAQSCANSVLKFAKCGAQDFAVDAAVGEEARRLPIFPASSAYPIFAWRTLVRSERILSLLHARNARQCLKVLRVRGPKSSILWNWLPPRWRLRHERCEAYRSAPAVPNDADGAAP